VLIITISSIHFLHCFLLSILRRSLFVLLRVH
jgi:hypothetical protein